MALLGKPRHHGLFGMMGLSFCCHIFLIIFLSFAPLPTIIKAQPIVYTVSLIPTPPPEPETKPIPSPVQETPKVIEKAPPPPEKPIAKPKKDDIVEKIKKPKKTEKPPEKKPEEKKVSPNLQAALEEIRKKAALDEIQKKVTQRERVAKVEEKAVTPPAKVPIASTATPSPRVESRLNDYYSLIWAKIKESWTIPENLLKETVDLEAIIIIIIERDGRVRRMWFEKKSNNSLYDQMAMRAIMKAEPLPPIPKEFTENSLEIGIRFFPE